MPDQSGYSSSLLDDPVRTPSPTPTPTPEMAGGVDGAPANYGYSSSLLDDSPAAKPTPRISTTESDESESGLEERPAATSRSFSHSLLDDSPASTGVASTAGEQEIGKTLGMGALPEVQKEIDPNAPWYEKIAGYVGKGWDAINAPLIDEDWARKWLGADPEHWSGWQHGLFDVASGLTSPLSIALAVGTFGSSSLLEAGGVTALKAAGMGAEEIGQVVKGSEIFSRAMRLGHDAETAMGIAQEGLRLPAGSNFLQQSFETLAKAGLKPEAMIGKGIIRRAGTAAIRNMGYDLATADKVAHWAQVSTDSYFTYQNFMSMAAKFPKLVDAVKDGNYDEASRYAIDALGSGAFTYLGAKEAKKDVGSLMSDAEAAAGLHYDRTQVNEQITKLMEKSEGIFASVGAESKYWQQDTLKEYKDIIPQDWAGDVKKDPNWVAGGVNESDLRARFMRESREHFSKYTDAIRGKLDPKSPEYLKITSELMPWQIWHDMYAEAAGRPEARIIKDFNQLPLSPDERGWVEEAKRSGILKDKPKKQVDQLLKTMRKGADTGAELEAGKGKFGRELEYSDYVGQLFDETNKKAIEDDILNELDDNYVSRNWKEENEVTKAFKADNYQTRTRQRTFSTTIEGLLKGYDLSDDSLIALAAHNKNEYGRIAANRQLVADFLSAGIKTKDGLPALVMSGSGHIVQNTGPGETINPAVFAEPKSVRYLQINPKVLDGYKNVVLKPRVGSLSENERWIEANKNLSPEDRAAKAIQYSGLVDTELQRIKSGKLDARTQDGGNVVFKIGHPDYPENQIRADVNEIQSPHDVHNLMAAHLKKSGVDVKFKDTYDPISNITARAEGNTVELMKGDKPIGKGVLNSRPDVAKVLKQDGGVVQLGGTFLEEEHRGRGYGVQLRTEAAKHAFEQGQTKLISDSKMSPEEEHAWESFAKQYPEAVSRIDDPRDSSDFVYTKPYVVDLNKFNDILNEKKTPAYTQLDDLVAKGVIDQLGRNAQGRPTYAYSGLGYKSLDVPAFKDWKFVANMPKGGRVFVRSNIMVHPEAYDLMSRRFGLDEGIKGKIPGVNLLGKIGREFKGFTLAFSPFHWIQEGVRAAMSGINPFVYEYRFNPKNPMHVLAAEKGIWEWNSLRSLADFEEGLVGHSELLKHVPLAGKFQSWTQKALFQNYIPGLKLRAFEKLINANEKLHTQFPELYRAVRIAQDGAPKQAALSALDNAIQTAKADGTYKPSWTAEKIANETAEEVNSRFGGIPYKRIGRAAAAMDIARLTALAPDWVESEMRFYKRMLTPGDEGALARRDTAKVLGSLFIISHVISALLDKGNPHFEAPFGIVSKDENGKEKVYSMRTLPTDFLHLAGDPAGFISGRLSPTVRTASEFITGRDSLGRKKDSEGAFVDVLKGVGANLVPMGVKTITESAAGEGPQGLDPIDALIKGAGFQVKMYRTSAEELATKLAMEKMDGVPIDPTKLRRHRQMLDLEEGMRQGRISDTDIDNAVQRGLIHADEAKAIFKSQGVLSDEPDINKVRLYSHSQRASLPDLIQIYNQATEDERRVLYPLVIKKKNAYVTKARKTMSPSEQATDPMLKWISRTFGVDESY